MPCGSLKQLKENLKSIQELSSTLHTQAKRRWERKSRSQLFFFCVVVRYSVVDSWDGFRKFSSRKILIYGAINISERIKSAFTKKYFYLYPISLEVLHELLGSFKRGFVEENRDNLEKIPVGNKFGILGDFFDELWFERTKDTIFDSHRNCW